MQSWVVMQGRSGSQSFWAWCRPNPNAPGFDDVFYTQDDGITPWSPPDDQLPSLNQLLFVTPPMAEWEGGDDDPEDSFPPSDAPPPSVEEEPSEIPTPEEVG